MTPCGSCGAPVPAGASRCIECGAAAPAPKRARRSIEIHVPPAADVTRVASALVLLTQTSADAVRRACSSGSVSVALHASEAELDVLSAALSSMGLSSRSGVDAPTGGRSAKLVIDSRLLVQAFVVVAVAVAGHVARAPSVPWLAIPVVAALFLGSVQWTEQAFEVPARSVEDKLGAVQATAWQEAGLIRRTIRDADSATAARRCVAILLELIGRTREGGRHLLGADAASLDQDLHALLCRSLRLAAATDRVSAACNLPDRVSPRNARLSATRVEMLAALAAIAQKLDGLGASLVELHGVEARNELLVGASSRLSEIQVSVQTGIELAALVDDAARGSV